MKPSPIRKVASFAALIAVAAMTSGVLTISEPSASVEIDKYADVWCVADTVVANEGINVTFKFRDGHVMGDAEAGTIRQTAGDDVNAEAQASASLDNPTNGWPSKVGNVTLVHVEAKLSTSPAEVENVNFYVEADPV